MTRPLLVRAILAGLSVLGVSLFLVDWTAIEALGGTQSTNDATIQGDVVRLSSKVSGYVTRMPVADYQMVHAGDLLFSIEDDDYRAFVARAEADVAAAEIGVSIAEATIEVQRAQLGVSQAAIQAANADLNRAKQERLRQDKLRQTDSGLRRDWETARANEQRLEATATEKRRQFASDEANIRSLEASLDEQRANVASRKAALAVARIDLEHTRIVAPLDGVVTQHLVHPGQLVSPGTLFISLAPTSDAWVLANYREGQLRHVRIGQPVSVAIDAFPGTKFRGHVDSIGPTSEARSSLLPPDRSVGNFTKIVQRVPVKIVLDQIASQAPRPQIGLSAETTIDVSGSGGTP